MANIQGNTRQLLQLNGTVPNTGAIVLKCKFQNSLKLDIQVSGLTDNPTRNSFSYAGIVVSGFIGATKYSNILPIEKFIEGTMQDPVRDQYNFVRNGNFEINYDISIYDKIEISQSPYGTASRKMTVNYSVSQLIAEAKHSNSIEFDKQSTIFNFPLNIDAIRLDFSIYNLAESESVTFILNTYKTNNSNSYQNLSKPYFFPDNIYDVSGGSFKVSSNGDHTIYLRNNAGNYLCLTSIITGNPDRINFIGKVSEANNEDVSSTIALQRGDNELLANTNDIISNLNSRIENNVRLVSDVMLGATEIPTFGYKYMVIGLVGTRGSGDDKISIHGYDRLKKSYSKPMFIYSVNKNACFRHDKLSLRYSGSELLQDTIVIPCADVSKVWLYYPGVSIDVSNLTVSYINEFQLKYNLQIRAYLDASANKWSYYVPEYDELCLLYPGRDWLTFGYNYNKGYTSGMYFAPKFSNSFVASSFNADRPRFYSPLGEALDFSNVYLPDTYSNMYPSFISNSKGLYQIKLDGRPLSALNLVLQGYENNDNSNPFTFDIRIGLYDKVKFYDFKEINKRTFTLKKSDLLTGYFLNSARYGTAHAYFEGGTIFISSDGARYYSVPINDTNFPGLGGTYTPSAIYILPCSFGNMGNSWNREWRLCVVFEDVAVNKMYHNFPESYITGLSGREKEKGIIVFEESKVWDLPVKGAGRSDLSVRRLPSKLTEDQIASLPFFQREIYKYFPVLPDSMYNEQGLYAFDTASGSDYYEYNGAVFPRYYSFKRKTISDFKTMQFPAISTKLTMLGHYATTSIYRCVAFATSDGGANWFAKFDYANMINPAYKQYGIEGNNILTAVLGSYTPDSLQVIKRSYNTPTSGNKEPVNMFSFSDAKNVSDITLSSGNETAIVTCNNHGLVDRDIILFKTNNYTGSWRCLANDRADEDYGGNGTFFVVNRIDSNSFKIYEYIHSPDHNITARHIHHINATKDGFILSSGEEHPDGFLVFLQQKEKDQPVDIPAYIDMPSFRLNSSEKGVYRSSGFVMLDDDPVNPTCFYASDESDIPRGQIQIEGRTHLFTRNSSGVFKGKLSDIDDFSKWECVLPVGEMILSLFTHGRFLIALGMTQGLYVSDDMGMTWDTINLNIMPRIKGTDKEQSIYLDNYKLDFK